MDKARIAELLRPFLAYDLSDRQLTDISTYIDLLSKWNQRMNLTAVRMPEEMVTRHFGESLFAAQRLFPAGAHVGTAAPGRPAEQSSAPQTKVSGTTRDEIEPPLGTGPTVVDVGSGAGFPGLPIKIWAPEVRLRLIESNHKKATFLKEVVRTLGLEGVDVFADRARSFPAASADVVTMRAVEKFEDVLPIGAALVKAGGRLALLIGDSQIAQATTIMRYLEWQAAVPVPLSSNRILLIGSSNAHATAEDQSNL